MHRQVEPGRRAARPSRPRRCRRTTRLSSTTATAPGGAGRLDEVVADRQHPPRVDDADAAALRLRASRRPPPPWTPSSRRRRAAGRPGRCPGRAGRRGVPDRSQRGDRLGDVALGEAHARSARRRRRRPRAAAARTCVAVPRRGQPQARHDRADRHVPHAVVRGAVAAGDAGAVQHEGHAGPVQRAVHQQLVEGPVEEGGVDGDDGVQPAEGQARRPSSPRAARRCRRRRPGRGSGRRSRRARRGSAWPR